MSTTIVLEQRQPKMQPFYWILTFEVFTLGMLIGLALAIGPFILIYLWSSAGMAFTLMTVPLGLWMFIKIWRSLLTRIWENRNRNQYLLYEDRIEYEQWNREAREADSGQILLREIKDIYYGRYVLMESHAYKPSKMTEQVPKAELLPALYIIYSDGIRDRLLMVPFLDYMEANRWLGALAPHGIPLWLTYLVIHKPEDESVPDALKEEETREAAEFDGNIERQFRPFLERKTREEQAAQAANPIPPLTEMNRSDPTDPASINNGQEAAKTPYAAPVRPKRNFLACIGQWGWVVFLVQAAAMWWLYSQAAGGHIDPANVVYPFALLILMSLLFFLVVKELRWPHMIVFWFLSMVTALLVELEAGSMNENDPTYEMGANLLAASLLYALLIWIPFFGIKWLRRAKDAGPQGRNRVNM